MSLVGINYGGAGGLNWVIGNLEAVGLKLITEALNIGTYGVYLPEIGF